jgi:methionyl-tRNA formyltransferase
MKKLNFAFFGTPALAASTLDALLVDGYLPAVIVTSPPERSGRGMEQKDTPVRIWAKAHDITCLTPAKIDEAFIEEFKKLGIELSIVIAYGKILPERLIQAPPLGTINIHYSILPKYRGASPIEAALLNNDSVTGVSIQKMVYKLDSGPVFDFREMPIRPDETKEELRRELTDLGAKLLSEILPRIIDGSLNPKPQDETLATHCPKIKKEEGEIDPTKDGRENYNKYRAYSGWPGVYFFITRGDKKIRIKITKARYENHSFIIERVIPEGKKETDYKNFI